MKVLLMTIQKPPPSLDSYYEDEDDNTKVSTIEYLSNCFFVISKLIIKNIVHYGTLNSGLDLFET